MVGNSVANINNSIAEVVAGTLSVASTIDDSDFDGQVALLSAVTDSTPLGDILGEVIEVRDFVVQRVELSDETTGEVQNAIRSTIVAQNGEAYHATSKGVAQSIKTILGILGNPRDYARPLEVVVVEEGKAPRKYFTIKPHTAKSAKSSK